MNKYKFKVGDSVEVVCNVGPPAFRNYVGITGKVVALLGLSNLGVLYRLENYPHIYCYERELRLIEPKKEGNMGTIREKIREALLSSDERLLRKHGVVSEQGNLTDVGRRVLCDMLFETNRDAVVAAVQQVEDADNKAKKSK